MILKKVTQVVLTACLLVMVAAVAIPNPQESPYKDRAEYDIVSKVFAEQDPAVKLELLAEWTEKYPETKLDVDRIRHYMDSYQKTQNFSKTVETAKELLVKAPGDFTANLAITTLTLQLGIPVCTADPGGSACMTAARDGIQAAKDLLGSQQFSSKPENVPQAQWDATIKEIELAAHQTTGWGYMQLKDNASAQESLTKVLEMDPSRSQVSFWLGNLVKDQQNAEDYDLVMFYYARASTYDGPNAMPAEGRQQVRDYARNLLEQISGEEGVEMYWPKFEMMARSSALPSERVELQSEAELAFAAEQAARQDNPLLYTYFDLKKALTGASGDAIWNDLRGKLTPKIGLYVVSADPPARPSTIRLASSRGGAVEVVVNLENRRRTGVGVGTMLTIDGVATTLTREPFRMVLNDGHTF